MFKIIIVILEKKDKEKKSCFFKKFFLLSNFSKDIILKMSFFTLSNVEINLLEQLIF